jgi:streptomycin 6-kinase
VPQDDLPTPRPPAPEPFAPWLRRWRLVPDGEPVVTRAAQLLPVRRNGLPAMLKVPGPLDESEGHVLMRWWDGDGAARVYAEAEGVLLLERALGTRSLADMARGDADDAACRILCAVAARLHAPRPRPLPALVPLRHWFRALAPAAATHGGLLARAQREAEALLAAPRDPVPLHGDLHHDNVLDFGPRGWLAIDPNRLLGERGFDFANIFTNPTSPIRTGRSRTRAFPAASRS